MKMFCVLLAIGILLISGTDASYAQFKQDTKRSLFSDVKAFETGDALMVLIVEDMQADNGASTNESRSTKMEAGANVGTSSSSTNIDAGLGTGNSHKATGSNSRSEKIRSRLSARVVSVEANGNLKIEGKRSAKIDGEVQTITIQGVVRPVDIRPDNTVYSYNILDLSLEITGDGNITKTQEPGLITKFLRMLF